MIFTDTTASRVVSRIDIIALVLIFVCALVFFTRDNTFPFYGHPDEPGKAEQVLTGKRNYNHPLLMLNSAAIANGVFGAKGDYNRAALIGRWVVAGYAAGAVALLAFLAVRLAGDLQGLARGVTLGVGGIVIATTPQLFEFARYFKEDPVFCFGLAVFLVAADVFAQRPSRDTLIALSIAMALALSSKYLGAIALPLGCWLIWHRSRGSSWWPYRIPALLTAFGILLLTFFVINYQAIRGITKLMDSLVSETHKAVDRPDGISRPIPNSQGWKMLVMTTTSILWLLLLSGLVSIAARGRRITSTEVFLILIPLTIGVATCFTDKMAERYFLPVSTLVSCIAMLGLVRLARWACRRIRRGHLTWMLAIIIIGAGLVVQSRWQTLGTILAAHQGDPRRDLVIFIRDHLPPSARIVSDKRVRLPNADQPENNVYRIDLPQQVILSPKSQFAADYAPFEELRSRGITHVALSQPDYGRFFQADGTPISSTDPRILARVAFYSRVLNQGKLIWESPSREINIVWPGLKLYELP